MSTEPRGLQHSDLGPSSKDWQPGSVGRDEAFSPEKDRWTLSRKGNAGDGRPDEDIRASEKGAGEDDEKAHQPGTGEPGKSWHSETPDPDDEEAILETTLEDTFPASDPTSPTGPATGWVDENEGKGN